MRARATRCSWAVPNTARAPTCCSPAPRAAGWELLHAGAPALDGARHLGLLEPEQLADAYAAANCLLFPTRYEACSYVLLEALASGTPAVTTRVGWTRTLLRELPAYEALCVRPDVARRHGAAALARGRRHQRADG